MSFIFVVEIGMPFVIQGKALSFHSLTDIFLMEHVSNDSIDSGNKRFKRLISITIIYLQNCIPICDDQISF